MTDRVVGLGEAHPSPQCSLVPRVIAAVAVLGVLLLLGAIPRVRRARALDAMVRADSAAGIPVSVAFVKASSATTDIGLNGSVEALHETQIYARSNGYVRRFAADIGSHVKAGQLLAEVETPELDHEVAQAEADVARMKTAQALAKRNLDRWEALAGSHAVSMEELDEHRTAYDDATASVESAQQNLDRLSALHGFAQLVAPFSGVITARNLDVGTLVAPPSNGATPPPGLYTLAETDTVRVMVNVPQSYVPLIAPGLNADVVVHDLHERSFKGKVARTANALDPTSRNLLVEVRVPNRDGALLPGMYADVRFQLDRVSPPVLIPASALFVRSDGPQVVVVAPDSTARFRHVTLGRDYGSMIEVLDGVHEGEKLVVNPSDAVAEGVHVKEVAEPTTGDVRR